MRYKYVTCTSPKHGLEGMTATSTPLWCLYFFKLSYAEGYVGPRGVAGQFWEMESALDRCGSRNSTKTNGFTPNYNKVLIQKYEMKESQIGIN